MEDKHTHEHASQKNIKIAFFLNFFFALLEIFGGLWTNSMAILSDALHDLGDSLSLGFAWALEGKSKKGPDAKYSFGYARFSLLGALINSVILMGGSIIILINVIPRMIDPQPVNSKGMLLFAVIGILVNGLAVLRLKNGNSINERVVTWHLMEDILGWIVILIASIVLMFIEIPIIDPILSLAITLFVLFNVLKNFKQIITIFLEAVPKDQSIEKIEKEVVEKTDALSMHHTHIWSLEGEKNLLSAHIVIDDTSDYNSIIKIKEEIKALLHDLGIFHTTLEIEIESEKCEDHVY